ncbi:MAG: S8 family serine peptidase [Deltaproteobacteria bacterium]|nr:S8 family serine peptidase [Deltaproteobacteria bacterium]
MKKDPDLSTATGAGVRVALIDSGINAQHSHVGFLAGGVAFSVTEDGAVQQGDDYADRLGHGTALAGILRAKAPQVELYAVKIFTDRLAASIAVLEAALRWAVEQQMQLINLSLGTANPDHYERLRAIVAQANAAGTLIVASSPPGRVDVLPAALPGVIGVAGDDRCTWGDHLYIPDDPIPFRAHPCPRPLPGPAQARNFRGHSFSSAHISALLALLFEQRSGLTIDEAREYLIRNAECMANGRARPKRNAE